MGYNRTKGRARLLLEVGIRWGETPRQVARWVDVTLTMVGNSEAPHALTWVSEGLLAGLEPGKFYMDMSTVSPEASQRLAFRQITRIQHLRIAGDGCIWQS